MALSTKFNRLDLQTFFTGSSLFDARISPLPPHFTPHRSLKLIRRRNTSGIKVANFSKPRRATSRIDASLSTATVEASAVELETDVKSFFPRDSEDDFDRKHANKQSNSGASGILSGVKLENISKSYKGVTMLKDVSWEVKKGEKVGLVGVNGAGKTTQLRIITGQEEPNLGNVIKAKPNMKVAFLSQEFEVSMSRIVKEEFMSAFEEEMEIAGKLEKVQKATKMI